ncbi:nuclear transport factor 2 family protein [Namhaeicola litoreus]|uniref:Nuclear transport factor 2 family protein n=1 Tax=Namhaeicola litoreus TaxID=1052145 RepID=A0ABW3XYR4_9FLAO
MNILKSKFIAILTLLIVCQFGNAQIAIYENPIPKYEPPDQELYDLILAKDKEYFDAYNTCDMQKQESLYSENLEFFHDKGGLTTS